MEARVRIEACIDSHQLGIRLANVIELNILSEQFSFRILFEHHTITQQPRFDTPILNVVELFKFVCCSSK